MIQSEAVETVTHVFPPSPLHYTQVVVLKKYPVLQIIFVVAVSHDLTPVPHATQLVVDV